MDRVSKHKSVQKSYVFTKGERCIEYANYPYGHALRTVVDETKKYWVLDSGAKYKKSDLNRSGFVGYSAFFIEPLTEESLRSFCCTEMRRGIAEAINTDPENYERLRDMYEVAVAGTKKVKPLAIYIMDRYLRTGSFDYVED